ncbi:hypothetical protein EKO23_11335 [Nocardioides guangzhouensis]|uniref:DUF6493 domain-containing protein n=1 Tax=Nocardioides guangzhouensis TaxID=2497878 RepID=A0A4Q4ZES0_9ACTN|nr:DUF6493 family protein [Nocardioides guangzhouensis]RYP85891.1 hypothetical protein EKO23_11335 [Nocardioides guangzhouensis]
MDADELIAMFGSEHRHTLVDRLAPLTEVERKKLAPAVRAWGKENYPDRTSRAGFFLAALGTLGGPRQVATAFSFFWGPDHGQVDLAIRVLRDRQPHWLPELPDALLAESSNWPLVRALVREGLAARPAESADYLLHLVHGVRADPRWDATETTRQCLERDPGLLEHELWDLLALETAGRRLAYQDSWLQKPWTPPGRPAEARREPTPERTWRHGLAALANDGVIDRSRLLDAALAAPLQDWAAVDIAWYVGLLGELDPTDDEVLARQQVWCRLLTVDHGPSVKLAQKRLLGLVDRLDVDPLLEASRATLARPDKSSVAAQLRLLAAVARAHPAAAVGDAAAVALDHPRTDVREQAMALLAGIAPDLASDLAPGMVDAAPFTAPAPVLPPEPERVVPVADPDELTELFLQLIEEADDPIAVERLLDGALRFATQRPAAAEVLLRRVDDEHYGALLQVLCALASAWLSDDRSAARRGANLFLGESGWLDRRPPSRSLMETLSLRLQAVSRAVRTGGAPSVALPTYADGSIDPADLSERLAGPRRGRPVPEDLALAVLRVHPDRLDEVSVGRGWAARIVARAVTEVREARPVWERVADVVPQRYPFQQPVAMVTFRDRASGVGREGPVAALLSRRHPLDDVRGDRLHQGLYDSRFEQALGLATLMLPHHPDHLAAHVHPFLVRDLARDRAQTVPLADAWARSRGPGDAPLASALVLGLAARDARARTATQDALLDLAAAGRLDGSELGRQAGALLADDTVIGKRVAEGLAATAIADDAAVVPVLDALAALLPVLPGRRDAGAFLEPAAELAERSGRPVAVPDELRRVAGGRSTSLAAKAARRLLAVE